MRPRHPSDTRTILVRFLPLLLAALLAFPGLARAQATPWVPPTPQPGAHDWIKLPSGEWLTGKIESMRNESIEFDSEELGLLTFEWSEIRELRSARSLTYAFTGSRTAVGSATLRDSVLRIVEGSQTREFRTTELISIIEGSGDELRLWSGKLNLGFVARSGNTDQFDYNAVGMLRRDGRITRFDLRYAGNFGRLAGVENVNNQLAGARLDAFLSPQLFVTPLSLEFYSDEFQNIDLRWSASAGIGFYFVKHHKLEWFIQTGAGYLSTRYSSVAPGESIEDETASFIPITSLEWKMAKDIELNVDYAANIPIPDMDRLFHHFVALLTIENLKVVDLTTSVTWDHVAQPQARNDGTRPDKNDLRTSLGIGIDF